MTDWYARCAYDPEVKQRFHTAARARLRRLATTLGFPSGSFDLRSNPGGIAVSGEITLHHERRLYPGVPARDRRRFRHPHPHLPRQAGLHRRPQPFCTAPSARRYADLGGAGARSHRDEDQPDFSSIVLAFGAGPASLRCRSARKASRHDQRN